MPPASNILPVENPESVYRSRLGDRQAELSRLQRVDNRFSTLRGLTFLSGLVLLIVAVQSATLSAWWLLLPLAIFLVLVILHSSVAKRIERTQSAVDYYQRGLDRLADNWSEAGVTGERYFDSEHMYSADLDLFGKRSLFQFLCSARTRLGEDTLAAWLNSPAKIQTIRDRQQAVQELVPALDLREQLALLDAEVHDDLDQNRLIHWSQETPYTLSLPVRILAVVFATVSTIGFFAWLVGFPATPLLISFSLQLVFLFYHRKRVHEIFHSTGQAGSGLEILTQVLSVIETAKFESPSLSKLQTQLETEGKPPSKCISRLQSLIQGLTNSLQNQFYAPISLFLCLPIHYIHQIERWRGQTGQKISYWLTAVGEFEAHCSFALYAFEHPDDIIPEIVESGPTFVGTQLAHPLLSKKQVVRNDISLGQGLSLLMISGSNMSGKSTCLRTIGTNLVLALAGAPVCAKSLIVSPCQVATAMRVHDSLQDGESLFYAAIARLAAVVKLSQKKEPLLFLLDEILQGTNSHDRRIGAHSIIRSLIDSDAVGLVTTHDLALTHIVDEIGETAKNVHFEDRMENGKMSFDYQMKPGVVERSNALELMRMMGLKLDESES